MNAHGSPRYLRFAVLLSAILAACSSGSARNTTTALPSAPASLAAAGPSPSGGPIDVSSLKGRIAFSAGSRQAEDVYQVNGDGSGLMQLTDSPQSDFDPELSPDGTRIAYRHQEGNDPTSEVYVANDDGSVAHDVSSYPTADWGPSWSPDGTKIVWNCQRDLSYGLRACVANADGTGLTVLPADIWVEYPAWSPDGTRIAFMSQEPEASGLDPDYNIYVMNADGTGIARLTDASGTDGFPSWSPDGTRIAFSSTRDDCSNSATPDCSGTGDIGPWYSIYVMNADGSDQQRVSLTFGQFVDWSPDGDYLLFSPGLNVIRPDGSGLTQIPVSIGGDPLFADWGV